MASTVRVCARTVQGTPVPSGTARWRGLRGLAVVIFLLLVLLPQRGLWAAQTETRASQESVIDRDAPPETRLRMAPFLRFGAEATVEGIWATNLDLDAAMPDDRALVTPEVALAVSFDPNPHLQVFLNVELGQDIPLTGPDESPKRVQFTLKEAFVSLTDVLNSPVGLRIGRQQFADDRE
jgi:hypothetical protein